MLVQTTFLLLNAGIAIVLVREMVIEVSTACVGTSRSMRTTISTTLACCTVCPARALPASSLSQSTMHVLVILRAYCQNIMDVLKRCG